MNISIVGLGLLGASIAKTLKGKVNKIYGVDIDNDVIEYALNNNIIDEGSLDLRQFIPDSDLIIFAIYPSKLLSELKKYQFKENQVITDICGIKENIIKEAFEIVKPADYCSCHPMAGREKVGIENSVDNLFLNANFLIIPHRDTKENSLEVIKKLGELLNVKNIRICDATYHDKMIGFTSTLTHAIAVALVNSDKLSDTKVYVGDSYRDLTRIAMINEKLWDELFFNNKDNLIHHIDNFILELEKIKEALVNDNHQELLEIFRESNLKRSQM